MKAYFASPISDQFNESYGQRGLQPSTGQVTPIRNVSVEYKNDPTVRRGGRTVAGGTIQAGGTAVQYTGKATKTAGKATMRAGAALSGTGIGAVAGVPLIAAGGAATVAGTGAEISGRLVKGAGKRVRGRNRKSIGRLRVKNTAQAGGATYGIWSWGFYIWIWFQIPLAIVSLVAMGLQQMLYDFYTNESLLRAENDESWLQSTGRALGNIVTSIAQWVFDKFATLTGLDPNMIGGLFLMTHVLVMFIGWFILFTGLFLYSIRGAKGISGKGGGVKAMAFAGAMIAYAIPVVNMFPWFFLWTLTVMKNPK